MQRNLQPSDLSAPIFEKQTITLAEHLGKSVAEKGKTVLYRGHYYHLDDLDLKGPVPIVFTAGRAKNELERLHKQVRNEALLLQPVKPRRTGVPQLPSAVTSIVYHPLGSPSLDVCKPLNIFPYVS
jgi:hypothetical protein